MTGPQRPARRVEVARLVPAEASVAFAWVADLRTHPRWIPLTRVDGPTVRGPEAGDRVTMVSGPVTDRMVVETIERPSTATGRVGRTRLRKLGPVLLGEAGFDVVPVDARRCRVVWWEEAHLADRVAGPLPRRLTDPLVGLALRALMHVSLSRLHRRLERRGR